MDLLVNENLNLAGCANLESGVNQLGNLLKLADVGLAEDGLGAVGLDILDHLLSSLLATS